MITLVLIIAALVLFILAGFGTPTRFNLIAFGLACCTTAYLVSNVAGLR